MSLSSDSSLGVSCTFNQRVFKIALNHLQSFLSSHYRYFDFSSFNNLHEATMMITEDKSFCSSSENRNVALFITYIAEWSLTLHYAIHYRNTIKPAPPPLLHTHILNLSRFKRPQGHTPPVLNPGSDCKLGTNDL